MTQQYSHRNGETEAPEVEGWYWVKYQHKRATPWPLKVYWNMSRTVLLTEYSEGDHEYIQEQSVAWWGDRLRWYGPIPEPASHQASQEAS